MHINKIFKLCGFVALGLSGIITGSAHAHHSFAMYDTSQSLIFTGVITQVIPSSAHLQIFFVPLNEERTSILRDDDGEPLKWGVEMKASSRSAEMGITVNNFPRGTIFSVGLHPLRNGSHSGARGPFGLYKCPKDTPPTAGMHCDSVDGATSHGPGDLSELEH